MKKCRTFKDLAGQKVKKNYDSWKQELGTREEKSRFEFIFDDKSLEVHGRVNPKDLEDFFVSWLHKFLKKTLINEFDFGQRIAMLATWQIQIERMMREFVRDEDIDTVHDIIDDVTLANDDCDDEWDD